MYLQKHIFTPLPTRTSFFRKTPLPPTVCFLCVCVCTGPLHTRNTLKGLFVWNYLCHVREHWRTQSEKQRGSKITKPLKPLCYSIVSPYNKSPFFSTMTVYHWASAYYIFSQLIQLILQYSDIPRNINIYHVSCLQHCLSIRFLQWCENGDCLSPIKHAGHIASLRIETDQHWSFTRFNRGAQISMDMMHAIQLQLQRMWTQSGCCKTFWILLSLALPRHLIVTTIQGATKTRVFVAAEIENICTKTKIREINPFLSAVTRYCSFCGRLKSFYNAVKWWWVQTHYWYWVCLQTALTAGELVSSLSLRYARVHHNNTN